MKKKCCSMVSNAPKTRNLIKIRAIGVVLIILAATFSQTLASNSKIETKDSPEQSSGVTAQQRTITGKVTDNAGVPLPGVTVVVQGTTNGIITDEDGVYTLTQVPQDAVLLFSFVGMNTKEVEVGTQSTIDVILEADVIGLEEVVAVGYGVQKKATLTGATTAVKSEELEVSPVPTVGQALAGKASGVMTRMADGRPGRGLYIQIRNMGTPLYVIDGTQSNQQTFDNLDIANIETITILKDASAAIYGIEAANGVVLVTTKSGRRGEKSKININSYYGWQNWTRFPRPSKAGTFVFAKASADVNQTMASTGTGTVSSFTKEEIEKWQAGTEPGYEGTDWYDEFVLKNAPQYYVNINSSGGSENTTYYLSLSKLSQDGTFADVNFNRINLQSNIESLISKRITIGAKISGSISDNSTPAVGTGDAMWNEMYGLTRNYPTWYPYANGNPDYPATTDWIESQHALFYKDRIGYNQQINRSFNSILYAQYDTPIKGLSARFQYTFGLNQGNLDLFAYSYNTYTYNEETDTYDVTGGISNGSHRKNSTLNMSNSYQGQLNYAGKFGDHSVKATYVFDARDYLRPSDMDVRSASSSNYLELIQYAELTGFSNSWSASSRVGHVGRINYDYKSKYLLELSGRYDASYLFPPGQRWGLFPSASAGWRISEESFYQGTGLSGILDNLKLRASYGMMGNESPGNYGAFDYLSGYDYNSGSQVFNGNLVVGTGLRNPGTTNITWAKAYILDIGLDFTIKQNLLVGEIDYFRRDMKGLSARRYDVLIPNEIDIVLPYENLESTYQQGVDGTLRHSGNVRDLNYSISVNAGFSRSYTGDRYKPRYGNSWDEYRTRSEGRFQGITWMYEAIGQFQSMEEINNYPVDIDGRRNTTMLPGDIKIKDVNGDGIINDYDRRPLGYTQAFGAPWGYGNIFGGSPGLSYGSMMNFSWKGIDLNLSWQGASLMTFQADWELQNTLQGRANSATWLLEGTWRLEDIFNPSDDSWVAGDKPPIRSNADSHFNSQSSTYWAKNVTYLRLRNVDIGYNIPKKYLTYFGIQNCRVYANAYNLFSIDNVKEFDIDPELSTTSGLQYPQSKIINVGVNLTF
ncbi:MAG TPA: TonB-dependent receptor [Draconibacterium sp.]|nr:TonB-dependent receptor [Draconibacterium sp.]